MEHFLQEYGSVILAILSAVMIIAMVISMCKDQGALYDFITFYCGQAV